MLERPPRRPLESPPGPFERLEAGAYFHCGLRANGRVDCWGSGDATSDMRLFAGDEEPTDAPRGSYRDFSVGALNVCALHEDGSPTRLIEAFEDLADGGRTTFRVERGEKDRTRPFPLKIDTTVTK